MPAEPQKSNPLNTSFNKTVYLSLFGAFATLALVVAKRYGFSPTGEEVAAVNGVIGSLITLLVHNKEPPN